ncbi:MAG: potassium transporter, partial [Limnobacter sp.]
FAGALEAATEALHALGYSDGQAMQKAETFKLHDQNLLDKQSKVIGNTDKVIEIGRQGREELEAIFQQDKGVASRS